MRKTIGGILVVLMFLLPGAFAATNEDSVWPLSNSTTPDENNDAFGPRISPGVIYDFHRGLDFLASLGTPVVSIMDGEVIRTETAEENEGTGRERFGNWIFINHSSWPGTDGQEARASVYMHLDDFAPGLSEGDTVEKGQVIGFVGNSGVGINTIHLHLELHKDVPYKWYSKDRARNPMLVLPYTDQDIATVTVDEPSTGDYSIKVSLPSEDEELDFNRIEIVGDTDSKTIDYDTREGIDPNDNDNNNYDGVVIWPDNFTRSHEYWNVTYNTTSSEIGTLEYVNAYDIHGNLLANYTYNGSSEGEDPLFEDAFDNFNQWTESGESDWDAKVPDEEQVPGAPSGNTVAHADNCDTGCWLTSDAIDLSGETGVTVSFKKYVDIAMDTNEYLTFAAYDGSDWNTIMTWSQGAGDDDTWTTETWNPPDKYLVSDFKIRFYSQQSGTDEEVAVDDVLVETSEDTALEVVFDDNLDNFNSWTESGEPDWAHQTPDENQVPGADSSNKVAEADNCDSGCTLTSDAIDLSSYSTAELSFLRYVDRAIDSSEYLNVEAYDGSNWNEIFSWTHGSGDDDIWHEESWNIPSSYLNNDFKVRFYSEQSSTAEEVGFDELLVVAE